MIELLGAFVAGVLTTLAPCVLPLLPVIVGGSVAPAASTSAAGVAGGGTTVAVRTRTPLRRALVITGSLGVSIVIFTLLLRASTALLGIAPEVWSWLSGGIVIALGLAALFRLVLFGLYGGSISDTHDRRTVALISSSGLWVCAIALVVQAWLSLEQLWLLYAVVAAQSAFFAVNTPARSAIVPRLIEPALLPAANALSSLTFGLGFMVGPVLSGLVIDASLGSVEDSATEAIAAGEFPGVAPTIIDGEVRVAGSLCTLRARRVVAISGA